MRELLLLLAFGVAYLATTRFSYLFVDAGGPIAIVWPPSGIALAALLLTPRRHWPAFLATIALSNFGHALYLRDAFPSTGGYILADVVEPLLGALLVSLIAPPPLTFTGLREPVALFLAATATNACTAAFAAEVAALSGEATFTSFFRDWWTASALGIGLITPLILSTVPLRSARLAMPSGTRLLELGALFAMWLAAAALVFWSELGLRPYVLFPLTAWAALRVGVRGTSVLLALLFVFALVCTANDFDSAPLGGADTTARLLYLQAFIAILLVSGLLFAVAAASKRDSEAALRESEGRYRTLNRELEARVAARTAELEAALADLESFSYSVSHDLRGPLRAIDGFSKALIDQCGQEMGPRGVGLLDRVRQGSTRMGALIDSLLGLARISRAPLLRVPVDLSELAGAAAREAMDAAGTANVRVEIAPDVVDRADAELVRVLLQNLLENAVKFTRHAPEPVISFASRDGVHSVSDNGAGFEEAYAERMFEPFQRLHRPEEFEGTGIGLATVQRIVRRHGGKVWAQGAIGQGATIFFTFGPAPCRSA